MDKKLTVGIIGGRGLLGKIFKKFFRKYGFKVLISGRKTKLTNIGLAKRADIIIVSVPIHSTISVIKEIAPYTRKEQLLMDFTSIKEEPIKEMLKSKASVIGLHPMFGKVESLVGKT
ncbi:prephenate dehydrogenase/arogenate dehydrogenase family protein, partial [Candidatus Pacearchaeota archaeon]|nr:prephenate dehydrogenase/arogenate dehydrogenase family protein [Candidatus Pacearchaeota archaeon]